MPGRKARGMVGALRKKIAELERQVTAADTSGSTPQTASAGRTRTRQPRRNLHIAADTGTSTPASRTTGGNAANNLFESAERSFIDVSRYCAGLGMNQTQLTHLISSGFKSGWRS